MAPARTAMGLLCTHGTTRLIAILLVWLSGKNFPFQNHLIETAHLQHPTAALAPSRHTENEILNFSSEVGLFSHQQTSLVKDSCLARKARLLQGYGLQSHVSEAW